MNIIKSLLAVAWITAMLSPVLGQQPVLDLSFDREPTGLMSDRSNKSHPVQMVGNLEFVPDRFNNDCRAVYFNGVNSFVSIPHARSLNMSSFTVSVWVKLPVTGMNELQWLTLICKGENPVEDPYSPAYRAQLTSYTASVNTASTKSVGTINQSFPESSWFHVAMTYDGKEMTIYRNGIEVDKFHAGDKLEDNTEPLNIGRDIPGNREFFEGTMDDLKLYSSVLSRNQIARLAADQQANGLGSACPPPPTPATPQPPTQPSRPVASQSNTPSTPVPDFSGYTERPTPTQPAPPRPQPVAQTPPVASQPAPSPTPQTPDAPAPQVTQPSQPTQPVFQQEPEPEPPVAVAPAPAQPEPAVILPSGNTNGIVETSGAPIPRNPLIQQRTKISEPEVTMFLYDHRAIDHDTVDIYLDGVLVLSHYELQRFDRAETVQLPLAFFQEGDVHEVSLVARNYGTAGTRENTIGIVIDGSSGEIMRRTLIIKRLGKPVGIKLVYKPE